MDIFDQRQVGGADVTLQVDFLFHRRVDRGQLRGLSRTGFPLSTILFLSAFRAEIFLGIVVTRARILLLRLLKKRIE